MSFLTNKLFRRFKFDDTSVELFIESELAAETFGTGDYHTASADYMSKTGYMLFYERCNTQPPPRVEMPEEYVTFSNLAPRLYTYNSVNLTDWSV